MKLPRFVYCALVLLLGIAASVVAAPLTPVRVSASVYAFVADNSDISLSNCGRIGNAGFIIGPEGIVVIDTGVSFRHGQEMAAAIRRISSLPIRLAIITTHTRSFCLAPRIFKLTESPY